LNILWSQTPYLSGFQPPTLGVSTFFAQGRFCQFRALHACVIARSLISPGLGFIPQLRRREARLGLASISDLLPPAIWYYPFILFFAQTAVMK